VRRASGCGPRDARATMPAMRRAARSWRVLGAALALAARIAAADETPADGARARVIRYQDDALTVHLVKVPLSDVLDELSRQSGAQVRGQLKAPRDVSAEFDGVPLSDALHRLMGDENFALVYGTDGRLRAVKLLGGPAATGPVVAAVSPFLVTTTTAPAMSPIGLLGMLDRHVPIPVSGRLAQILGSDTASMRQLLELGLHNEDPGVRAEAVRTGMQVVETEPELRSAVVTTVSGMDEVELGNVLRGLAGERAEEMAMHIATQTRVTELRVKAAAVLQKLRAGG
jgi:hypothetical protein